MEAAAGGGAPPAGGANSGSAGVSGAGAAAGAGTSAPGGAAPRGVRFMMEGVGARVIRGPDWKWGKQVLFFFIVQKWWNAIELCTLFIFKSLAIQLTDKYSNALYV